MKTLFVLSGPPASGKSTYLRSLDFSKGNAAVVSRDQIRFSMLMPWDDYFAHEDEVWHEYVRQSRLALELNDIVFLDATHINPRSRTKILRELDLSDAVVMGMNFHASLDDCIARNAAREGRAHVPESALRDIYERWEPIAAGERFFNGVLDKGDV